MPDYAVITREGIAVKKPEECGTIEDVREAIDAIDREIIGKIAERSAYVLAAAKFKKSEAEVRADDRVKRVIASRRLIAAEYGVSPDLVETIYREMIDHFIREETREWEKK
jgi:isochorismate pyruvate lyase